MLMSMKSLLIGQVADQTGIPAPTIRYYESIGLLKAPARSPAGYRRYNDGTLTELRFIRKAQALGFSLDEISEILSLSRSGQRPCARVLSITRRHVEAIDARIGQLQRFRRYLKAELEKWERQRTATTPDGLCEWIANSDPGAPADAVIAAPPSRARSRNTSS